MSDDDSVNKFLSNSSDETLLELAIKKGRNSVLSELYNRYSHLVYGVCLKYFKNNEESEDAVMHIFEDLLVNVEQYTIKNFKSWLFSVARNYCLMELRHKKVEQRYQQFETSKRQKEEMLHPVYEETQTEVIHLKQALSDLNEEQRRCLELFYFEEQSYKEISDFTGLSIKKVKSYIQNGKRNLRLKLSKIRIS